ncbi:MAG: hypothetical protein RMJ82_15340 [Gemmatales bacterium]|nr:hypothetical protein [Gemmatales bacterium]
MKVTRYILVMGSVLGLMSPAWAQLASWKTGAGAGVAFSPDGKWLAAGGEVPFEERPKTI